MDDFELWYGTQYARVLSTCVALVADLELAQEAVDEAFARACERWVTVAVMVAPGGWVQAVALNELRRSLRRRRIERLLLARRGAPVAAAIEVPDARVWAAVRKLPSRQRTAIVLRYVHDLSEAEVAASMGVTRGAASSSLSAARSTLRHLLGDPIIEEAFHG